MASKVTNESDKSEIALSEQPNQPASFAFPKRNFGSSQRSLENLIKAFVHDLCIMCTFEWHPCNDIGLCGGIAKLLKKQPSFMYQLHILKKLPRFAQEGAHPPPAPSPYLAHNLLPGLNYLLPALLISGC